MYKFWNNPFLTHVPDIYPWSVNNSEADPA